MKSEKSRTISIGLLTIVGLSILISCAMDRGAKHSPLTYTPQKPAGHIGLKLAVEKMECEPKGSCDDLADKMFNDLRDSGLFDAVVRPSASGEGADILLTIKGKSSVSMTTPWTHYPLVLAGVAPVFAVPALIGSLTGYSKTDIHSESTFSFMIIQAKTFKEIAHYEKKILFHQERKAMNDDYYNQEMKRMWEDKLCALTEEIMSDFVADSEKMMLAVTEQ